MTVSRNIYAVVVRLTILAQYTYLLSIPLIMVYAFGFTYMKYQEGYTVLPGGGCKLCQRALCLVLSDVLRHTHAVFLMAQIISGCNLSASAHLCNCVVAGDVSFLCSPTVIFELTFARITHLEGD